MKSTSPEGMRLASLYPTLTMAEIRATEKEEEF